MFTILILINIVQCEKVKVIWKQHALYILQLCELDGLGLLGFKQCTYIRCIYNKMLISLCGSHISTVHMFYIALYHVMS